jgi:pyrroline-5-carboxylate reductase
MPNMPAQIGAGTTVYVANSGVSEEASKLCRRLLDATGMSLLVPEESLIDPATAVVGSGPAYLYYLLEHFTSASEEFGFSKEDSARLVQSTWEGALRMLKETGLPPGRLREMVTSKGGTTAAALDTFESEGMAKAFKKGIQAAAARARALGQGK